MLRKLAGPLARRWAWMETTLRVQERFGELHGGYLASSITLTAFLSLFPLLLLITAVAGFVAGQDSGFPADVVDQLGLKGEAANAVIEAIRTARENRGAATFLAVIGLLWSGLGLVAAISFALDAVWQVKSRGIKDKLFGLAWLVGAGLMLVASALLTALLEILPGPVAPLAIAMSLSVSLALWLWTLKVLANRQVGWRPLVPGAILGAVGFEVLKIVGGIYVPRAVASSSAIYGSIGIVFAILAWLLFFGRLIVYASVLNVVRWEENHGTVTIELEVPDLPDRVPTTATRAGEAEETPSPKDDQ